MNEMLNIMIPYIMPVLQIALLNLILSVDNVGVIALAVRNIEPKSAKKVSMMGISGAIILRIFFASILTLILNVEWLPIKLIGGILLLKITWDLINEDESEDNEKRGANAESTFWKAVLSIVIADLSMSLDNVLAIAASADGNVWLITFGILINIPIIFFGSQFVADLMKKYRITIYIGGAVLMHTALKMILEDRLIIPYVNHIVALSLSWLLAIAVLIYGYYKVKNVKVGVEPEN